jgi:5-methylcytosine-specific restriction endonuclease McrA
MTSHSRLLPGMPKVFRRGVPLERPFLTGGPKIHSIRSRMSKSRRSKRRKSTIKKLKLRIGTTRRLYGDAVADLVLAHLHDPTPMTSKVARRLVFGKLSNELPFFYRARSLNRVCGLPLDNQSWSCSVCGFKCDNPRFFDIDHVIPRSKGGGYHGNRQALCPNCHRCKTLSLPDWKVFSAPPSA